MNFEEISKTKSPLDKELFHLVEQEFKRKYMQKSYSSITDFKENSPDV